MCGDRYAFSINTATDKRGPAYAQCLAYQYWPFARIIGPDFSTYSQANTFIGKLKERYAKMHHIGSAHTVFYSFILI